MEGRGDAVDEGPAAPHTKTTSTQSNPNVFDDEYAVSASSSDAGSGRASRLQRPTEERRADLGHSNTAEQSSGIGSSAQALMARNSIHKPRQSYGQGEERSSASPHLGTSVPTALAALPQRAGSTASSYAPTDRGQSPPPQSNPAYPYGLYQQSTTMGRTPSMATESTVRPPSTIASGGLPRGPTHPYALYTQNGLDEDAESVTPAPPAAPVGFAGAQSNFHRRIGPDGEEQGIIGPDGHTEQLPPYSEYPEHGAAKVEIPVAGASPDSATASPQEISPTSTGSEAQIVPGAGAAEGTNISEKHWKDKTWRERRRTKICGGTVPCWMLAVMVGCGIIIVGLIAGLIGGLLSAEHKSSNGNVVTTTLYDASQIATPTGVPGPPSGSWALSLGMPEETQPYCLTDSNQYNAWTCATNGPPLKLDVKLGSTDPDCPGTAQIGTIIAPGSEFNYGTQPPVMDVSNLEWVSDLDDPNSGPALHFQAYYDKQVIVDESELSPPSLSRRHAPGRGNHPFADFMQKKGRVVVGDQPWLCYWNATFLEGFIYMEKNSTDAASQSSFFASATATTTSVSSSSSVAPGYQTSSYSSPTGVWRRYQPGSYYDDDSAYTGAPAAQSTNPSLTTSSPPPPSSSMTPETPDSVYTLLASASGASTAWTVPTMIPLFPHIIKLEERRMSMPNNDAYCVKMQLLNDEQLVPYEMPNGTTLTFQLSETDPSGQEVTNDDGPGGNGDGSQKRRVKRYRRLRDYSIFERAVEERGEPGDSCHCQWKNR